jgi:hypothetical protein
MNEISEKTIYGVRLGSNTVISVKEYTEEAKINEGKEHKFIMSVSYLSGAKRGTVFFLTETGYIVGKYYEYSVRSRRYRLLKQTTLVDSADVLFDQFENDYRISPHLQAVDFDVFSCGVWISKRFSGIHPKRTHSSIVKQFVEDRGDLDYSEKLRQQLGRRDDPIERVISIFHEWKKFIDACTHVRNANFLRNLESKKRRSKDKRFSFIPDEKTEEDRYNEAVDEINKIKIELEDDCSDFRIVEIKRKLPELKAVLDKKPEVEHSIKLLLENLVPIPEDTEVDEI